MYNSPNPSRGWLIGLVLLVGVAIVWALTVTSRSNSAAAVDELRRECAELRTQVEACNRTMTDLQVALHQPQSDGIDLSKSSNSFHSSVSNNSELALVHAVAKLVVLQSNTAFVVERLLSMTPGVKAPEPPEETLRRVQAGLATLEASAADEQQRYEALRQKATELLINLNVPDDVATISPSKGLDMLSLRAYWPYFEAKRELEAIRVVLERLQYKLIQERVDAGIEAATRKTQ